MAQLSYRTGSLNSFLDSSSKPQNNVVAYKNASSKNKIHNIKKQSSLQFLTGSPVAHRASEDHIHRIRSGTARGDFKQALKIQVPCESVSKPSASVKCSSGSEDDDVESVDWTAPLDITAYLYKPEYIIRPGINARREDSNSVVRANQQNDFVQNKRTPGILANRAEGNNNSSMKEEILKSYVSKSIRGNKREQYKREICDYAAFVKELNDEIREVSQETKRLEMQSPRGIHRKQENRDVVLNRGYTTLKHMYQLNPGLAESAVKKNTSGPPGAWMGLSRADVLEIMQRIRKELSGSLEASDNISNTGSQITLSTDKKGKGVRKGKNKQKKPPVAKARGTKQTPKLKKAPQVPLQHIPGPAHLHTNICIRRWEPMLDGWNLAANDMVSEEKESQQHSAVSDVDYDYDNPPNSPRKSKRPSTPNKIVNENPALLTNNAEDKDFLTLEIFNPIFKTFR